MNNAINEILNIYNIFLILSIFMNIIKCTKKYISPILNSIFSSLFHFAPCISCNLKLKNLYNLSLI